MKSLKEFINEVNSQHKNDKEFSSEQALDFMKKYREVAICGSINGYPYQALMTTDNKVTVVKITDGEPELTKYNTEKFASNFKDVKWHIL